MRVVGRVKSASGPDLSAMVSYTGAGLGETDFVELELLSLVQKPLSSIPSRTVSGRVLANFTAINVGDRSSQEGIYIRKTDNPGANRAP